jgi:hypothetical protein
MKLDLEAIGGIIMLLGLLVMLVIVGLVIAGLFGWNVWAGYVG